MRQSSAHARQCCTNKQQQQPCWPERTNFVFSFHAARVVGRQQKSAASREFQASIFKQKAVSTNAWVFARWYDACDYCWLCLFWFILDSSQESNPPVQSNLTHPFILSIIRLYCIATGRKASQTGRGPFPTSSFSLLSPSPSSSTRMGSGLLQAEPGTALHTLFTLVFPSVGVLLSAAFSLSPLPRLISINKAGELQGYDPLPPTTLARASRGYFIGQSVLSWIDRTIIKGKF